MTVSPARPYCDSGSSDKTNAPIQDPQIAMSVKSDPKSAALLPNFEMICVVS